MGAKISEFGTPNAISESYEQNAALQAAYDKESIEKSEVGLRFNKGKLRFDLLPPDGIEELVKVYTKGAEKYSDRNWEKGMPWMTMLASLKRHLNDWELGEDIDDESKLWHMAHVTWNALGILTYQVRNIGTDNRPKI